MPPVVIIVHQTLIAPICLVPINVFVIVAILEMEKVVVSRHYFVKILY